MSINREEKGLVIIESTVKFYLSTAKDLFKFENATFIDPSWTLLSRYMHTCNEFSLIVTEAFHKFNKNKINSVEVEIGDVELVLDNDSVIAHVTNRICVNGEIDDSFALDLEKVLSNTVNDGIYRMITILMENDGISIINDFETSLDTDDNIDFQNELSFGLN